MSFPLTEEQKKIVDDRGGELLVSAAAGSGKTRVLVERLMGYVEAGEDIDRFLVITYTKAAAAELRGRIAQELGVSKTTVSRALSGKGRISAGTRERVNEFVNNSGYEAGSPASPLERRFTNNLALVIPSHFVRLDLPFLRKCMGGVCRMAAQRGYDVLMCFADDQNADQLRRQLAAHKIDGVILSRTLTEDACLDLVRQYGAPFVGIGRLQDAQALQVDNDQVGATRELTRLLLQMGLRRIVFLSGRMNYTVNVDRLAGYRLALEEYGVAEDRELIFTGVETEEGRVDALESALERAPECLLCCDDSLTFSILKDLRSRGISVPGQIRLASLYDSEILLDVFPAVTAVQFDAETLGATACRMLLDSMAGREVVPRQIQGYQVIMRESTK